ncbi:MAG: DUF2141 domain-containing protein [Bacteroidales bacterium]|jgi:uncharacterized protein (DUF2141 family)|nr:DUF2141 domain-containing protein [Bacteroidales bacterium]
MKTRIVLFIAAVLFSISGMSQKYTVEFVIKNVKNDKGVISAALFSGEENFPDKEKALYNTTVSATKGELKIRFENIPAGEYALAVFHDENNNKDFDTNFIGIPKEAYGFSNNSKAMFGLPKYKDAKFRVSGGYYSALYLAY